MHARIAKYLMFGLAVFAIVGIGVVSVNSASRLLIRAEERYNPQQTPTVEATDRSVNIRWRSRDKVISIVQYGTASEALDIPAFETSETTDHNLTIANLLPATNYYYRIFSNKQLYPAADSAPLSFSTLPPSAPTPTYPPCLVTVFESYYGSKRGDARYSEAYDLYPPGRPDGLITSQDYLQCIRVNPPR